MVPAARWISSEAWPADLRGKSLEEVEVYYPPNLTLKQGSGELRIGLRGFLGYHWLEVTGAKGIACLLD